MLSFYLLLLDTLNYPTTVQLLTNIHAFIVLKFYNTIENLAPFFALILVCNGPTLGLLRKMIPVFREMNF